MIFFTHECVCHTVMRNRRGIALFSGEKQIGAGLAARTTVLVFMGEGSSRCRDAVGDNRLEKAQPPETDQESARWMQAETSRRSAPVRLGRLLPATGALRDD